MKTKENLKNNNFTKLTRSGISLIVLVITIIVIIILAAAIIISLNNNNPIMESNKARYESDRANMQAVFTNAVAKVMAKNQATLTVSPGQINTITGGVKEVEGEVVYTLTDAQNAANATGTIVFDKGTNTDTKFYTGKQLPIYAAGETKWYVDEEGNISLEVAGTKYGSGEAVEGGNGGSDEPEVDPNAVAFAVYSETDNSLRFYKRNDMPQVGETYNELVTTAIYENIETTDYKLVFDDRGQPIDVILPGWNAIGTGDQNIINVSKVIFEDKISPVSTFAWFMDVGGMLEIDEVTFDFTKMDTSNLKNMGWMFNYYYHEKLDLSTLKTSNVTDMTAMFAGSENLKELDLGSFDTRNVTNMNDMFNECKNLTSLNLSSFDTSNVTNMYAMFQYCQSLTSIGYTGADVLISENFNTNKVTDMGFMFGNCVLLETVDVSKWNTSNVTNMSYMFANKYDESDATMALNQIDISNFDTRNVADMSYMFYNCKNLTSAGYNGTALLYGENFDGGINLDSIFKNCENISSLDLSNFDTSKTEDMSDMFAMCWELGNIDVSNFNTSNVTDMKYMFNECHSLTSLDVSNFNTSNVVYMNGMFGGCYNITSLDLSNFNTSKVRYMDFMFSMVNFSNKKSKLASLDLRNFNTSNVENMMGMFGGCENLISLDISSFNTSNVIYMDRMFFGCSSFTSAGYTNEDLLFGENFDTSNVTDMYAMFHSCESIKSIDLSAFNTSNVTDMNSMFAYCTNLETIYVSDLWNIGKLNDGSGMFRDCTKLVGDGLAYNQYEYDELYACHTTGYLTYKLAPTN